MTEDNILQLPKRNNYHYNVEYVDGAECVVIYYRLSDMMWNRHVEYCDKNGFENKINQWLRIIVDVDDFEMINGWSVGVILMHLYGERRVPYTRVFIQKKLMKKTIQKIIHRHILNPPKELQIDHINHNTLDNRRCNLRLVTQA